MSGLHVAKSFSLALASTVLLFLSGVAVPLAGILLLPLVPQPVLAFGLKYGKHRGVGLVLTAILLLSLLGSRELGFSYSILGLMVASLFFSFGRGWSIEAVVVGTAAGMFAAISAIALSLVGSPPRLQEVLATTLKDNLDLSLKVYENIGFSSEKIEILKERAPQIIDLIVQILPALAFIGFAIVILINLFFLHRRYPERHSFFMASGDLKEWKSPEPLIWCFILSGFSLFLPGWEAVRTLALNLFLVIAVFYFFQGLAIVAYYFHHKRVPFFLRSLAYVLIVFEQFFTIFVVGLGLFDLWGDFRRLRKKDLNPSQVS